MEPGNDLTWNVLRTYWYPSTTGTLLGLSKKNLHKVEVFRSQRRRNALSSWDTDKLSRGILKTSCIGFSFSLVWPNKIVCLSPSDLLGGIVGLLASNISPLATYPSYWDRQLKRRSIFIYFEVIEIDCFCHVEHRSPPVDCDADATGHWDSVSAMGSSYATPVQDSLGANAAGQWVRGADATGQWDRQCIC